MAGNVENQSGHQVPVGTSAIVVHAGTVAAGAAGVLPVGGNQAFAAADTNNNAFATPRQGTIRNGRVYITTNLTGGGTYEVSIRTAGVDRLTLEITRDGATGVLTIPGTVSVAIGELVSVRVDDTAAGGVGSFIGTVSYELV